MKCIAVGSHLQTTSLFEPAKQPDDRADYCLDCSFLPQCMHQVLVFTLVWSWLRLRYGRKVVRARSSEHSQ